MTPEEHKILIELRQAIMGNGVKGLGDRVTTLEEQHEHRKESCPILSGRRNTWLVAKDIVLISVALGSMIIAFIAAGVI